jgi:hypothetical protein
MKKLLLFAVSLLSIISCHLSAQSTFSFLPKSSAGIQTSVIEGTTVIDSVWLINNGPDTTAFQSSISIVTAIVDSSGKPQMIGFDSVSNAPIARGGIQGYAIHPSFNTPHTNPSGKCRIGNNVVVIWPVCNFPHFKSTDTLRINVYVLPKSDRMDIYDLLNVFPNPTTSILTIAHHASYDTDIAETKIYDLNGRLLNSYGNQRIIDVSQLPRGIYLVKVVFTDGTEGSVKIWKD